MTFSTPARLLAAATLVALTACGGGSAAKSTTAPAANPTTEAQREKSALPMAGTAAVPNDVKCGAAKPVWVNLNTKAYHTSDDPYYGKTKNGKYECAGQADADGYHAAGAMHSKKHKGGAMNTEASPADNSTP